MLRGSSGSGTQRISLMSALRILVTDVQERSTLAAVRCLGNAGYRVTATATGCLAPGFWSRCCAARTVLPDPATGSEHFVHRLEALVRRERHEVLIPGTDVSLHAISCHRERLERYVRLGLPSHDAVLRALDKECLAEHADAVGLDPPEERSCEDIGQARQAADEFGYPVLVKPARTVVQQEGGSVRYASRLAHDEAELLSLQQDLGRCLVQRRCPGAVVSFAGLATDAGLAAAVVSRYRRTWPPAAGNVCFSETISAPKILRDQVQALIRAIGWRGLFELELIERGNGRFTAIDLNPRAYGSLALALAAGVPLPALWCEWLLGATPAAPDAHVGIGYRWEDADLWHLLWHLNNGDPRSALAVARPRRRVTHAYFRLRDPAPALARGLELARLAPARPQIRTRRSIALTPCGDG